MDEWSPSSTPESKPPPPRLLPPLVADAAGPSSTPDENDEKTKTRQRRLSFGVPETPAAPTNDPAAQIASLLRTVAELEKTSRRTQAENEQLRAYKAAADLPGSQAPPAEASPTRAAISELAAKLNTLTEVVIA